MQGWETLPGGGDDGEEGSHVDIQGQCGWNVASKAKAGEGQMLGGRCLWALTFVPHEGGEATCEQACGKVWFTWRSGSRRGCCLRKAPGGQGPNRESRWEAEGSNET